MAAPFGDTGSMMLPRAVSLAIVVAAWAIASDWFLRAIGALRGMPTMLNLTEIDPGTLPALPESGEPHLTVIVPARDEADSIERTLRSLLAQTGVQLQIIAVDDRSTDGTGEIMDALAAESASGPRSIEVLHLRELPAGWLGKPHALAQGIAHAHAQWFLFTDGDVRFAPDALHLALQTAIREKADHFVLGPTLECETLTEKAIQAIVQALGHRAARLWKVGDRRAKDCFGIGGFSLVRAEALAAVGGMQRLRMEVVEDVALGWLMKRELKRHSLIVLGPGLVRLRWIRGPFGIVRLLEKNAFAGMRYSVPIVTVACLALFLHALLPLAALGLGTWGIAAAAVFYLGVALTIHANRKLDGASPLLALLFAPCALILVWAFLRSMLLTLVRGGVEWRGTHYPLQDLKRNMVRFRMF
jgi:hypothetical protein